MGPTGFGSGDALLSETSVQVEPTGLDEEVLPAGSTVTTVSKSPLRIAMHRLLHDKVAMISLGIFVVFILIAIFAPLLVKLEGNDPSLVAKDFDFNFGLLNRLNGQMPLIGLSAHHWFGIAPKTGEDLFGHWVYGARPSLIVATSVTAIGTVVGVTVGLTAGFLGGWVDRVLSWIMDFFLSIPYLLFAIAVPAVLLYVFVKGGPDNADPSQIATIRFASLILVLSLFGWAGLARLIRGQVLSLREREFIQAAKVLGVPTRRILFKELLPNLVAPIIVSASLTLPAIISAEAALTFIGVGLIEPTSSWGIMISQAQNYFATDPSYFWIPVSGIILLVLALSLLGDGIRDAFDPKTRR